VGERFVARIAPRGHDLAQLGPHRAVHHLRRARRLLRPTSRRPPAVTPDDTPPLLGPDDLPGG
jgi:hypothetical protein